MIAIGIPPGRIDFLNSVTGLQFDSSWVRGQEVDFGGVSVRVVSKEDLITSKRAAGRPQDLMDLEKLEN
jgi:predicted nucleotidyltransferase